MLIWITILVIALIISSFLYYRYGLTSQIRIGKLDLVQFYQLVILSPVVFISLMNIVVQIISRPEVKILPVSSNTLFTLFSLATAIAVVGNGIHSTAKNISESFPENSNTKAFLVSEFFHWPVSHLMIYLGSIAGMALLSLLEINHPSPTLSLDLYLLIVLGIIVGLIEALSIIWSNYVKTSLTASLIALAVVALARRSISNLENYPLTVVALSSLTTLSFILFGFLLITIVSHKLTKKLVKLILPTGHPIHDEF